MDQQPHHANQKANAAWPRPSWPQSRSLLRTALRALRRARQRSYAEALPPLLPVLAVESGLWTSGQALNWLRQAQPNQARVMAMAQIFARDLHAGHPGTAEGRIEAFVEKLPDTHLRLEALVELAKGPNDAVRQACIFAALRESQRENMANHRLFLHLALAETLPQSERGFLHRLSRKLLPRDPSPELLACFELPWQQLLGEGHGRPDAAAALVYVRDQAPISEVDDLRRWLLPWLSPGDREVLLEERLAALNKTDLDALGFAFELQAAGDILVYLPEQLPLWLARAAVFSSTTRRSLALQALAPAAARYPGLREAFEHALTDTPDPVLHARACTELARYQPRAGWLQKALSAVSQGDDLESEIELCGELVHWLDASSIRRRVERIEQKIAALACPWAQTLAITLLLRWLPDWCESGSARLLERTRSLQPAEERLAFVVHRLLEWVPEQRDQLVEQALAQLAWMPEDEPKSWMMAAIGHRLSGDDPHARVLGEWVLAHCERSGRCTALHGCRHILGANPDLAERALTWIESLHGKALEDTLQGLDWLPAMSASAARLVATIALRLEEPVRRVDVLLSCLPHLPSTDATAARHEIHALLQGMDSSGSRCPRLAALAAHCPELERTLLGRRALQERFGLQGIHAALAWLSDMNDPHPLVALLNAAPHLWGYALDQLDRAEDCGTRLQHLAGMVPALDASNAEHVLERLCVWTVGAAPPEELDRRQILIILEALGAFPELQAPAFRWVLTLESPELTIAAIRTLAPCVSRIPDLQRETERVLRAAEASEADVSDARCALAAAYPSDKNLHLALLSLGRQCLPQARWMLKCLLQSLRSAPRPERHELEDLRYHAATAVQTGWPTP